MSYSRMSTEALKVYLRVCEERIAAGVDVANWGVEKRRIEAILKKRP